MDMHNSTEANEAKILKVISAFVSQDKIEEIWIDEDEWQGEMVYKVEVETVEGFSFRDFITKDYELL